MKKFGLGSSRKGDKGDDDSNKAALFGNAKSSRANVNPYAAMGGGSDDPYAPRRTPPPSYDNGSTTDLRREKSPVPPGGYGGGYAGGYGGGANRYGDSGVSQPRRDDGGYGGGGSRYGDSSSGLSQSANGAYGGGGSRYGDSGIGKPQQNASRYGDTGTSYGDQGGYGSNRFGDSASTGGARRQGGYGGMGQDSQETEQGRQNLFGDAPNRYAQQTAPPKQDTENTSGGYGANAGGYGAGSDSQGYGAYGDRQLTAEEQEEEDIQATKQEIRFIKQQDVSSTRNALRLADQAYQTGASTLERLGAQGERIHNTERNLDLASIENRVAREKAAELKTLNRSMFAVHVNNPFTSTKRREEREAQVMDTHRKEREARDASRAEAYQSAARQDSYARDLRGNPIRQMNKASLAERSKYQFEADSEDEAMENEIDDNLDQLHGATGKLKHLALAMGKEVDVQNKHIDRITGKVDRVDDEIALNRARLDRIK